MNHPNPFKNARRVKRGVAPNSANLREETFKAFEAPNLEEGHNAVELSLQRYSIFSLQNVETGHFDVTFLFDTKELHVHSFILWSASEVFETMLFGAWAKKEPIPITAHSYNDFKEFLTFLYLGKCKIDMDNVMAIVDLAESYNVQLLKDKCDQFLTHTDPTPENVFKICETLKIYSLQNALDNLYEYITINAVILLKNQSFLEVKKDVLMDIVKLERLVIKEEDLFDSVYKWAEYQYQKQETENSLWIKNELSDILPFIRFPIMNIEYLHSSVVPLGYLFSSFTELSLILRDADAFQKNTLHQPASQYPHTLRKGYNLEIADNRGNFARAYLPDITHIEKSAINGNQSYNGNYNYSYCDTSLTECCWQIVMPKPIKKSFLLDPNSCKYYIIRNDRGHLALKYISNEGNPNRHLIDQTRANWNRIQPPQCQPYQLQQKIFRINPNGINNDDDTSELDIIARAYVDKENFVIGQGCKLKII